MVIFNNLHAYSHYSVLRAVGKVRDIVELNVDKGATAVALTEYMTLASSYELWRDAKEFKVKPIIGLETNYIENINNEESELEFCGSNIVILAQNLEGWYNLKYLHNDSWTKMYYRMPRVDLASLRRKGFVVLTGYYNGIVDSIFSGNHKYYGSFDLNSRKQIIKRRLKKLKQFAPNLHLEIQLNDLNKIKLNKFIIKMSKELNVPIVVTNQNLYLKRKDVMLKNILDSVRKKTTLDDIDFSENLKDNNIKDFDGLEKLRKKYHKKYITKEMLVKWCEAANEIVKKIQVYNLTPDRTSIPKFCENPNEKLKQICDKGFVRLIKKSEQEYYNRVRKKHLKKYRKRYKSEMKVITDLGYADYFLIVWDIANEARRRNIPFNTRGSVCGSMVAFLLGISWIDPIRFDCSFERFLTKDRISMPDIDMDFGSKCRDEMIQYLRDKYTEECVTHICNYGVYKPRSAIKDVARVHNFDYKLANNVNKLIPDTVKVWEDIPPDEGIKQYFKKFPKVKKYGKRLIGTKNKIGVHASGIIVTPDPLPDWLPWTFTKDPDIDDSSVKVTEWNMYDLEDLEILKLDFLGVVILDIVQKCIELISRDYEIGFHDFDTLYEYVLNRIDDKKVFEMCAKGNLIGTFQMGTSDGMRTLIQSMKPDSINDIIASVALYRTAVLQAKMHDAYVRRKHGEEEVEYLHPKLEKIMNKTYGVMLYQEDVMKTAVELAGFTPTESDHFRKGIKLKDPEKFKLWKDKFINGCIENNIEKDIAKEIWKLIYNFAGYGFCVAHATTYGVLAYITAWLKCYYPFEYMTAVMTCNQNSHKKLAVYIKDCKAQNITIDPPDINQSTNEFVIHGDSILFPFEAIKQCGPKAVNNIMKIRKKKKFTSLKNFYKRVNRRVVNVGVMINLILTGAFREFGSVEKNFNRLMKYRGKESTYRSVYCDACSRRYPISVSKKEVEDNGFVCPNCGLNECVFKNKGKFDQSYINVHVYGFVFDDDPLKPYIQNLVKYDYKDMSEGEDMLDGQHIEFPAQITKIKKHTDRKGNEMAFLDVRDSECDSSVVIFSNDWAVFKKELNKGNCCLFQVVRSKGNYIYNGCNDRKIIKLVIK